MSFTVISPRPDNINLDQLSFDSRILPRPQSSLVDTTYVVGSSPSHSHRLKSICYADQVELALSALCLTAPKLLHISRSLALDIRRTVHHGRETHVRVIDIMQVQRLRRRSICQKYELGSGPANESKPQAWARTQTLQLIYAKRINFLRACEPTSFMARVQLRYQASPQHMRVV